MQVTIQNLESKLYLTKEGSWVKSDGATFKNAVDAISFCIQRRLRSVRLAVRATPEEQERYLYPFGEDPVIKAENKKLRRSLSESRRLKRDKRVLLARLDMIRAETKELKKEIPFKRKPLADPESLAGDSTPRTE